MNEENIDPADAHQSLCWTCQFGICVRETEIQRMIHPSMGDGKPKDLFDESEETNDVEMVEHIIEHKRVKTVCYWKPDSVTRATPLLFGKVEQCNRYKKNT